MPSHDPHAPIILKPLFGGYCRTNAFRDRGDAQRHVWLEATPNDGQGDKWTVSMVCVYTSPGQNRDQPNRSQSVSLKKDVDFMTALKHLATFEEDRKRRCHHFDMLTNIPFHKGQNPFDHYIAFAEREGYIFDIHGMPYSRTSPMATPVDGTFNPADIERADNRCLRESRDFILPAHVSSPLQRSNYFLDSFKKAARKRSYDETMEHLQAVSIMDKFIMHIEKSAQHLSSYTNNYEQESSEIHYKTAIEEIDRACLSLRQLNQYERDIKAFNDFVDEYRVTCKVLYAQGIFDNICNDRGDRDKNIQTLQRCERDIVGDLKNLNSDADTIETIRNMITQGDKPVLPYAVSHFIEQYKEKREQHKKEMVTPPKSRPQPRWFF